MTTCPNRIVAVLLQLALVPLLISCASIGDFLFPEALDKDANLQWRKDLKLKINGTTYRGMALVPKAESYLIKIYPNGKRIDRLQWRTCHGDDYVDKAVKHGFWFWGKKDKYFPLKFKPNPIEIERACPLQITALAEKHRSMSFGMVIFPYVQPWISLPASLECNREIKQRGGTSECEAPVGAINRITFQGKIYQDDRPNRTCPPMTEIKEGVFEYFMPKDLCIYVFKSPVKHASGEYLTHKMLTYGYEKTPPPEGT